MTRTNEQITKTKNEVVNNVEMSLSTVVKFDILGVRIRLKKLTEDIIKINLELSRISELIDYLEDKF